MPTDQEIYCAEIADLQASLPTCPEDAVPFIHRMFQLLVNISGCAPSRNSRNFVYVPVGTLTSQFVTIGWGGLLPSAAAQPLLYVIRGCEVFLGVNNSDCDLGSGAGWCPLCTARTKLVAQLILAPEQALSQSASYNARPTTGEWTEYFNNGVSLQVGGQPSLANPLVNVPTHCFELDEGLHQIDVSFSEQYVSSAPNGNNTFDMRLFDVTNNAALFVQQRIRVDLLGSAPHRFTCFVNPIAPTVYRLESRVSHTASSGYASSGFDEIIVERIA